MVVDSGSTDRTLEILAGFPQVEVVTGPFDTHARQWNCGLELIGDGWVLSLDADYGITPALRREMAAALQQCAAELAGFRIPFRYCVRAAPCGARCCRPASPCSAAPRATTWTMATPRTWCCRAAAAHCASRSSTTTARASRAGSGPRSATCAWKWRNCAPPPATQLSRADRLRQHHVIAPFAVLLLCLVWHRGLLDGWRGWYYAFQRMYVELMLSLMLWRSA